MKRNLLFGLLALGLPTSALAEPAYGNYEEFYKAQPKALFDASTARPFEGIQNGALRILGNRLPLKEATAFPGEKTTNDQLGPVAKSYRSGPYACVEGISATASGTAVRYPSVYLALVRTDGKPELYKLPSLFASCLSVHFDDQGRLAFFAADLRYRGGESEPMGSALREFVVEGKKFIPTGRVVLTRFPEQGNVWKFEIESGD